MVWVTGPSHSTASRWTDTHSYGHTRSYTETFECGFTVLQFCLVSGAESRGMFPRHGPAGRGLERLVTHMVVSLHLYLSGGECFFPSYTLSVQLLLHFCPAATAKCRHKQDMTEQWLVCPSGMTHYGCGIRWCYVQEIEQRVRHPDTFRTCHLILVVLHHFFGNGYWTISCLKGNEKLLAPCLRFTDNNGDSSHAKNCRIIQFSIQLSFALGIFPAHSFCTQLFNTQLAICFCKAIVSKH